MNILAPQTLLDRLDNRLAVLTGGPRDVLAHQQTLRRTIDWSYDLLEPHEQQMLSALSVFVCGWTLDAAEAICAALPSTPATPSALDMLASLQHQSLMHCEERAVDQELRFGMRETIREYARERLRASAFADAVYRHHAAFYLALAEQAEHALTGPDQRAWLDKLESEHDNLRAALAWACANNTPETVARIAGAIWRFWHVHGHLSEGRQWLETAGALHGVAPAIRAKVLAGAGWMANVEGNIAYAEQWFRQSLEIAQHLGNQRGVGLALSGLGRMAHLRGDAASATTFYEHSLALQRAEHDTNETAWSLIRLGLLALEQCAYARATALLEESLACFRRIGYLWGVTWALTYLGNVALGRGDGEQAMALYHESLAHFRTLGDKSSMAISLAQLGQAALAQGQLAAAAAYYQQSVWLYQEVGITLGVTENLEAVAVVAWQQSNPYWAVQLFSAAWRRRGKLGLPTTNLNTAQVLAQARSQLGDVAFLAAQGEGCDLPLAQLLRPPDVAALPVIEPAVLAPPDLTIRERDVLRLVATGITDAQVANALCISPRTVHAHLRSIYSKLGVSSRSAVTRLALERKLV